MLRNVQLLCCGSRRCRSRLLLPRREQEPMHATVSPASLTRIARMLREEPIPRARLADERRGAFLAVEIKQACRPEATGCAASAATAASNPRRLPRLPSRTPSVRRSVEHSSGERAALGASRVSARSRHETIHERAWRGEEVSTSPGVKRLRRRPALRDRCGDLAVALQQRLALDHYLCSHRRARRRFA